MVKIRWIKTWESKSKSRWAIYWKHLTLKSQFRISDQLRKALSNQFVSLTNLKIMSLSTWLTIKVSIQAMLDTVFQQIYWIKLSQKCRKYHCSVFPKNLLPRFPILQKYSLNGMLLNQTNKSMIFTKSGKDKTYHTKKIVMTFIKLLQFTIKNRRQILFKNSTKIQCRTNQNNCIVLLIIPLART